MSCTNQNSKKRNYDEYSRLDDIYLVPTEVSEEYATRGLIEGEESSDGGWRPSDFFWKGSNDIVSYFSGAPEDENDPGRLDIFGPSHSTPEPETSGASSMPFPGRPDSPVATLSESMLDINSQSGTDELGDYDESEREDEDAVYEGGDEDAEYEFEEDDTEFEAEDDFPAPAIPAPAVTVPQPIPAPLLQAAPTILIPPCPSTHGHVVTSAWAAAQNILAGLPAQSTIPFGNTRFTGPIKARMNMQWRAGRRYSRERYYRTVTLWICMHATELGLSNRRTKQVFDVLFPAYAASLGFVGGFPFTKLNAQFGDHVNSNYDLKTDWKEFRNILAAPAQKTGDWAVVLAHVLRAMQQLGIQSNSKQVCQTCVRRPSEVVRQKAIGKYTGVD
ncbi:hypothetical protein Slin15195_G107090 [Septoria linicola]|uniref:Uncharacterized protein n=1 Tax=Septoria linicola TaxID=215465 RepID=A0A9Q9ENT6_9PEZI|nr:hypothetical protein Slin14017_G070060 [Septoria linicola]USW57390.1 hypothetical protein Slin15195_G107090 [Septoria linicola]